MYIESDDYFENINSASPFQKINDRYYTTIVLLIRFAYKTLSKALLKNKTFQIHSGFVFEDKVLKILEKYGFTSTGITRINHKEFDLVTIKEKKYLIFNVKIILLIYQV